MAGQEVKRLLLSQKGRIESGVMDIAPLRGCGRRCIQPPYRQRRLPYERSY